MTENISLLEKGFAVIELISRSEREIGVSEISRSLNMAKSGVFRILSTLKSLDYVYQNPVTKNYGLGIKFFFIGSVVQRSLPLVNLARRYVDPLGSSWGYSFSLSIPYFKAGSVPDFVVIYANASGSLPLFVPGDHGPLHATAAGKCLLAFMSRSELQTVQAFPAQRYTRRTLTDWKALDPVLEKIRSEGIAAAHDEYREGLTCYAVPVFDSMHSMTGALTVSARGEPIPPAELKKVTAQMKQASARIGACL